MRIAVTVDPYLPVPPRGYGGIERIVDFLVRGLVEHGHEVTLLAHPASRTPAPLLPYGSPPHTGTSHRIRELRQVAAYLWRLRHQVDLVHSFGRLAALLPILPLRSLPKIQSYQRHPVPWRSVRRASFLGGSSVVFTGCSTALWARGPNGKPPAGRWVTVYNGVDVARYRFVPRVPDDAPLVFLGRLERIKGVHNAIAIARAAGRKLVIAGNRVAAHDDYFRARIAPYIDGESVVYVGEVGDAEKNELLGSAAALLMPVEWEEPFGIVMAEAMACGTPVIGFERGAVPEVVTHGVTGFVCRSVEEAAACVARLSDIDRGVVRRTCETRFGNEAIVRSYERLYEVLAAGQPAEAFRYGTVVS